MGGDESTFITAQDLKVKKRKMCNPLIASLGISDFNGRLPALLGIPNEYKEIRNIYNKLRGYSMIYMTSDNKMRIEREYRELDDKDEALQFKIKWDEKEIKQFNNNIFNFLEKEKTSNFDGLIYFISCHGNSGGIIYDSNCTKVNINCEFLSRFDNEKCSSLYGKPKLFLLDCCRGKIRTYKQYVENTTDNKPITQLEQKMNDNNGDGGFADAANEISSSGYKSILDGADDIRVIFANTDGHAVFDGGIHGGYLIRSICQTMKNKGTLKGYCDFDKLVLQARKIMNDKLGSVAGDVMDDWNNLKYKIKISPNVRIYLQ